MLSKPDLEDHYSVELLDLAIDRLDRDFGLTVKASEGWLKVKRGDLPVKHLDLGGKLEGISGGLEVILARAVAKVLPELPSAIPLELRRFLAGVTEN